MKTILLSLGLFLSLNCFASSNNCVLPAGFVELNSMIDQSAVSYGNIDLVVNANASDLKLSCNDTVATVQGKLEIAASLSQSLAELSTVSFLNLGEGAYLRQAARSYNEIAGQLLRIETEAVFFKSHD